MPCAVLLRRAWCDRYHTNLCGGAVTIGYKFVLQRALLLVCQYVGEIIDQTWRVGLGRNFLRKSDVGK